MATVWFGDGQSANTTSSVTYTYQSPGKYLVAAQEYMNGQPVASTFNALRVVQVTPKVDPAMAPKISIPTLAFNLTKNPSAPVVQTGDMVYLAGGFLEAPSGANISISNYAWDFGNTVTKTVAANATSLEPTENPVTATYSASGLYPVKLTLTTEDKATMNTYTESVEQTVAVGTASQPDALFLYSGKVPNPNVINVAENVAGGPYSFDPQVDYESVGFEVISNIYSTLIIYNGSSTTEFIPEAATQLPSTTNGQISPDFTSYTFQVRTGLKFSNGDPLTSYDVWYSIVRDMLFIGGAPGTPDWILAQYLISGATIGVPIMSSANDTDHFNAIMAAVTYSNSSNTVTFKLAVPTSAQLFFTALADPLGAAIIDANWVEQIGAGVTFTPAGFYGYQSQGNEGSYNTKLQQNPVTSGPYQIESYVPGQSVTLIPNSGFQGVPGIPTVNNTVVIQWVKDPETAYNLFTSGQVDMLAGASPPLPTNYFPLLKQQVASGQAALYQFPTLSSFFFIFNVNTNTTLMKTDFGSQYNMPSDYFANLDIRQAFAYAFNYTNYIDQIEGNAKYGIDFGSNYAGLIIQGLPYHVPESELQNVPTYDLTQATQLLHQSGLFDTAVNIPIAVTSGDTVDFAAAQMWAAAVNSIDPNIVLNPTYIPFSTEIAYSVPGQNPMPIYYLGWIADYPYPSDFVDAMYKQGGTYPSPDGWTSAYLNQTGHSDQGALYAQMNSLIKEADSTTDPTIAASDYKQAEQIAINLYMYVYSIQPNEFWVVKSYMNGYGGQINIQENSMIAGAGTGLYFWWTKG
jgi:ABC-type transport system substrate-binding protein